MDDDHPKDISTFVYADGDDEGHSANDDAVITFWTPNDQKWMELDLVSPADAAEIKTALKNAAEA